MTQPLYGAVILAAGYSTRMQGNIKALLPVGRHSAVVRLIRVFRTAGIERVMVVLGHYQREIGKALEEEGVESVWNPQYAQGMFCSVQAGVKAISDQSLRGVFLLPVDSMLTQVSTVTGLMQLAPQDQDNNRFVVYPTCSGVRGHPPLIGAGLIADILRYTGEGGLQRLLQILQPNEYEFQTSSDTVLLDIDTTDEYAELLKLIHSHPDLSDI